ncbi:diaminobutyrate acetyltransferase [Mariprofundus erugo]|uniref:diaminobutyrate acetyltransferase n=1 Tax=Mariprofundus erugo TaxID=2528639 RepID=UPI001EE8904C|nr:diaminobutyrate acetyltransferase [Mariprofundus erugo]
MSFRAPVAVDGPAMYALVERCPPLDLNSRYCYLILCDHFASTCVVAEQDREVLAFVTGYIPPDRRDTLFVWQVAVDHRLRGQGVAGKMLRSLLERRGLKRIRYVEATVNPSNDASRALFRALARESNCHFDESLLFDAALFGAGSHEQENLVRVGPLDAVSKTLIGR